MATKNRPRTNPRARQTLTTHEGAPAKRIDVEAQLRRSVMACLLWEDTFYESGVDIVQRITELCYQLPTEVISRIAIEAREEMNLRHAPLWLVRQMARKGGRIVGQTLARVIQRADELTEFLALYWDTNLVHQHTPSMPPRGVKRTLPAQVKLGLADAFTKFDAYQLAKYDREGAVRLRDVLFLVHPKPKDAQQAETWKALVDGTLPAPDTWEVSLSAGKDKTETWTRLISEKRIGGLAMLRNLRNMEKADVDPAVIRRGLKEANFSRVLPFRFLAAARYAPKYEPELEQCMFAGAVETPKLAGKTALVLDHSGSMEHAKLSAKSDLNRGDAAAALGVLLREVCEDVVIIAFSSAYGGYEKDAVILPPRRGFALVEAFKNAMMWWGTNTESGVRLAKKEGYDRIIVVTDEQSHQVISGPGAGKRGYFINVGTYRNGIGYGKWTHIDGWSESVVRYIQAAEAAGIVTDGDETNA
jgi:60 kDa SS-A/Ro ribonucleoprotein